MKCAAKSRYRGRDAAQVEAIMESDDLFNAGASADLVPEGDEARQAVASLRGYAYQVLAAGLEWLDIGDKGRLFLEVAEDYAIVAEQALTGVQVKDTEGSGSVTLNTGSVREAVAGYVGLVARNPHMRVELRYFTTSDIGTEQAIADRPARIAGLDYWRKAASGADCSPLRAILESEKFAEPVRAFVRARDDLALRRDLLGKIHWDCGKPDFLTLRQELEERLVVVARDRFNLPAPEARRLADVLIYRVLKKSIIKTPSDRILTRAALYAAIDAATRLTVPRSLVDALSQLASGLTGSLGGAPGSGKILSTEEQGWLVDGATLPAPRALVARVAVESAVAKAVGEFGIGVLVGSSGLGKSNISRAVAVARAGLFTMVDFRETDALETRRRLDTVFAHIGGVASPLLMLEDVNELDDTRVAVSLGRVIQAARRRDCAILITCYRKPSLRALTDAGLDQGCVVDCPYFTEEEAHALVRINGGDPEYWGRLAYVAGAGGHPQLTHAFVVGLVERGWPTKEIRDVLNRGLSSDDVEAARDAARRNLVSALPEGTRNILYRLSLRSGRFSRSLALAIGRLPPPVTNTGESMDQLVVPWIEALGKDSYRVSPLASSYWREMLPLEEQTRIHRSIAVEMLRKGKIDASDADAILMHAISGKSENSLVALAQSVLTASPRTLEMLSEQLIVFPLFRTDTPIFAKSPFVSGMLRLAQFNLVAAAGEGSKASDIATALFNEIAREPEGELRRAFEGMALTSVLSTMGVASYLYNWIDLLRRYKAMVDNDDMLRFLKANVERDGDEDGTTLFAMLFGIGSAHLSSVARLEQIIDELDSLDAGERALWLAPVEKSFSDYSVFINGPWVSEQREVSFDATDAATRYRRMTKKTEQWGIRSLSAQCYVAQAVMLDEYRNDKEAAFAVLNEAVAAIGDDVILARARAKVYWRHDQHATALGILRGIADQVGADNPVERAFALREAAISAAKTNEWPLAEKWFVEAQLAAALAQTDDMRSMAVGLGADAAVAALEIGEVGLALTRFREALEALASIDPDASLRAGYCHRVIRHAVLWTKSRVERTNVTIGGKPIGMEAGTCSNPDPLPAIREMPLGPIDLGWYMLAEVEIAARVDVGIVTGLNNRLTQGPIPFMESGLRAQMMQVYVDSLDAGKFAAFMNAYIEAAIYMVKVAGRLKDTFDALAPERGQIPALVMSEPFDPVIESVASDAIIAYALRAALADRRGAILELEAALDTPSRRTFPVAWSSIIGIEARLPYRN
jgi:hypothetical protein